MAEARGGAARREASALGPMETFIRELREAHAAGDRAQVRALMQSARAQWQESLPPAQTRQPARAPGRDAPREGRGRRR